MSVRHVRNPWPARLAVVVLLAAIVAPLSTQPATAVGPSIDGRVVTSAGPLASASVTLVEVGPVPGSPAIELGTALTDAGGAFRITAIRAPAPDVPTYLLADAAADGPGGPVVLASSLGTAPLPTDVVVNERTTVAAAYANAQFIDGNAIGGMAPGPRNAAAMARNLVDPVTGELGEVLTTSPNGTETSTLATVNSLTNVIAGCTTSALACDGVLTAASAPGEPAPNNLFQALATIARNPAHAVAELYALSLVPPAPHAPALDRPPAAWTVALRFDGDGQTLDGPGNFAVDHEGNLYVVNNYQYGADPSVPVCASDALLKFTPSGEFAPGSPFRGGGLSGAGFGVAIDPYGNIWAANYGFAAPAPGCPDDQQPPHNSVSLFTPDGVALSPSASATSTGGFTQGGLSWPQGAIATDNGDVWFANCGNDSVTRYPDGDPNRAQSIGDLGLDEPFDLVDNGRAIFVSGAASDNVAVLNPDGTVAGAPITGGGLDHPMGVASDAGGNVWVANSGIIDLPCPNRPPVDPQIGSLTLLGPDGTPAQDTAFTGGGLTVPWGITTDGDGNVWVANFAGKRLSHFCGTDPSTCPPGLTTGDPISPALTGYFFDGLVRNTGVIVDPSGNVWLTNNWLEVPVQTNPGGHEIVAYVGLAPPVLVDAPRDRPQPEPTSPSPAPTVVPAAAVAVDPRFTG